MNGRTFRRAHLSGSPDQMGADHGAQFTDEIRAYTEDRVARSAFGTSLSRNEILELADACLPAHEDYDADLTSEMYAMAAAAGITPGEALIVGGYTDFIDLVRANATAAVEDNCTAVLVPDGMSDGAGWFAQTWDMHASATEHVVMLEVAPNEGPAACVFTTVGCLGQIGMNEHGLTVGINNLTAADGRVGVTWPFVVRKMLTRSSAASALEDVLAAPLAGGHNFLVMDASGEGFSVEAMPTTHHVERLADDMVVHTNHCLAGATKAVEGDRPDALQASSIERLTEPQRLLASPVDLDALITMLGDEREICRRVEPPYDYESCGAVVMRPRDRELWACWGIPADNTFEKFEVSARV